MTNNKLNQSYWIYKLIKSKALYGSLPGFSVVSFLQFSASTTGCLEAIVLYVFPQFMASSNLSHIRISMSAGVIHTEKQKTQLYHRNKQ